jgi:hypothetical protein
MSMNMAVPDIMNRMWKSKSGTLVKDRCFRGVGTAVLLASLACAQTSPAGHWEGVLNGDGGGITVSLDLARNNKAEWVASMGVPSQNATGLVVKDLVVTGTSVKFMAVELRMAKLDLTLGDGKLGGTLTSPGGSLPIQFNRTGEANVQLPAASPAVSKDLEGDWAGIMKTPGPELEIAVHFKNQPDNTVMATIDIPAQNAMGMPIDVKQTGDKVEFGLGIAHALFKGTLSKDRRELSGLLGHDEQAMQVTLKKK